MVFKIVEGSYVRHKDFNKDVIGIVLFDKTTSTIPKTLLSGNFDNLNEGVYPHLIRGMYRYLSESLGEERFFVRWCDTVITHTGWYPLKELILEEDEHRIYMLLLAGSLDFRLANADLAIIRGTTECSNKATM